MRGTYQVTFLIKKTLHKWVSEIAEKEVCFQWKWNKKMHPAEKGWLITHPRSIPLGLFCWVKSVQVFSLFLTHLHSFQIKSFQLIYWCTCIARQVINVHFSTTFIKSCLQCVMSQWISCPWLSVFIQFEIVGFQDIIEHSLECPVCVCPVFHFW